MKLANRDVINVVKWANIPNFSALDNLETPLRLLESFFVTYQLIGFLDTSSCTVEKAGTDFEITNEKISLFLSVLLFTGYHKLPGHKTHWEATPDTFVKAKYSMPHNTFERILQNLHLCDNRQLDK